MPEATPHRAPGWPRGYVIAQPPNPPLLVAQAAFAARLVLRGRPASVADAVSVGGLAVWSVGEAAQGVNAFRRALGVAGLGLVALRAVRLAR